jgi:hypothetical protein
MLNQLSKLNPQLKINEVKSQTFTKYGQVLQSEPFKMYIDFLNLKTNIPYEGNRYVANDQDLTNLMIGHQTLKDVFGGIPLQYGYVNGQNTKLNALEYHKSSEIIICASPIVLLLAQYEHIEHELIIDSSIEAFFCETGTVIELYPMTLHFSPCKVVEEGFKCGIVLPYGTNMELVSASDHSIKHAKFLFKTNKWIFVHPENQTLLEQGAKVGIKGKNIDITHR